MLNFTAMIDNPKTTPTVLSIAGHDPSGGAGVQADIESLVSMGCHACTVITAMTVQDTCNAYAVYPQPTNHVIDQIKVILDDFAIQIVKIGLLGSATTALAIADLLEQRPDLRVVLDPVLTAGGGTRLVSEELVTVVKKRLLPLTTVITPNAAEARVLTGLDDLDECGRALLALGCNYALVTGGDEPGSTIINRWFGPQSLQSVEYWQRFEGSYHGSGCTLASALAGLLAHGHSATVAAQQAQQYTWEAIQAGLRPGKGQMIPGRLFWAAGNYL